MFSRAIILLEWFLKDHVIGVMAAENSALLSKNSNKKNLIKILIKF